MDSNDDDSCINFAFILLAWIGGLHDKNLIECNFFLGVTAARKISRKRKQDFIFTLFLSHFSMMMMMMLLVSPSALNVRNTGINFIIALFYDDNIQK